MSELRLTELKSRRGTLKEQVTRFAIFLDDIQDENDSKINEVQVRMVRLENNFTGFESVQYEIEQLANELLEADDADLQKVIGTQIENSYYATIARADSFRVNRPNDTNNVSADTSQNPPINRQQTMQCNVKLPQLSLPDFSGSYDKWTQFFDTFTSLIDNNLTLSNIQKYYYLQSCLKGEAAKLIQSLEISEVNYAVAWGLLKERYENKKLIIKTHLKEIVDLPIINRDSHTSLRSLLDTFQRNFRSLKNLKEPVEHWSTILIYLLVAKLDANSKREWEIQTKDQISPKIDSFISFLTDRCHLLESIDTKNNQSTLQHKNNQHNNQHNYNPRKSTEIRSQVHLTTHGNARNVCIFCNNDHNIYNCPEFLGLPISTRISEIRNLRACTNCLRRGHTSRDCYLSPCRTCNRKHNILLHLTDIQPNPSPQRYTTNQNHSSLRNNEQRGANTSQSSRNPSRPISGNTNHTQNQEYHNNMHQTVGNVNATTSAHCYDNSFVLLSTAIVYIYDENNIPHKCRALLDNGSQSSFLTTRLCEKLNLRKNRIHLPLIGINSSNSNVSFEAKTKLKSTSSNYEATISFLIIDQITGMIPQHSFDESLINIPRHIVLADCTYNQAGEIDILIGAEIFFDLLLKEQIQTGKNNPILQNSKLGWIISGPLNNYSSIYKNKIHCNFAQLNELHDQLETFWLLEESDTKQTIYSIEESECEKHFVDTFKRNQTGRFVVELPKRDNSHKLQDNKEQAIQRFNSLERKMSRNAELKENYVKFMKEYVELGHMTEINDDVHNNKNSIQFYLPHHCVKKETSETTKLRVVFDASAKCPSGVSLNDILKTGPCIQEDIFSILLRFRTHVIAFTADIEKMYRQILVEENDKDLQRIVWRSEPTEKLTHYKLNTITYGTTSASFLATRCLKQLAIENAENFPSASSSIKSDFYMDDWISGAVDIRSGKLIIKQVNELLNSAGLPLRQWVSNNTEVLEGLPIQLSNSNYTIKDNQKSSKTLGIHWNASKDYFKYETNLQSHNHNIMTKRRVLSVICHIYDPLGLIGPVVVLSKFILQRVWKCKTGWDEPISSELMNSWSQFHDTLPDINNLRITRRILVDNYSKIEMHCFSDSSQGAYGACIYLLSRNNVGETLVRLICAKSKVAPLKTISLPRLELCGALISGQLCKRALQSLKLTINDIYFWTDSTIVLKWVSADPSNYNTFVSNRISQIQKLTKNHEWKYVPTDMNPADLISRGCYPAKLNNCSIWWSGPSFLQLDCQFWPSPPINSTDTSEMKRVVLVATQIIEDDIICKYSSYIKLIHVVAYILRFRHNALLVSRKNRITGNLKVNEIEASIKSIVKLIQRREFHDELQALSKNKNVSKESKLYNLNPFTDEDGIMRVGGRLKHSQLEFDKRHPIIIPSKHHFTSLVVKYEHNKNLHAGCQLVLANVRNLYWPINGRQTVRRILNTCVTCFKVKPKFMTQLMGQLPATRVTPSRPFSTCGIDYAGPYLIKDTKLRNRKLVKAYICLFVCFSSKAVHLELVSDLTTESFLNAFKRFVARRGICSNIYSDNAKNFVGANKHLLDMFNIVRRSEFQSYLADSKITWRFIPARSPHHGGLWESAVRSTKYHIKRIVHNIHLSYEEFYTLLTQIESILNSRPIYPLTEDPEDLQALTPGHFLIGTPLTAPPENPVSSTVSSHVSRYKCLRALIQQFWTKWSKHYLNTLQQRTKWRFGTTPEDLIGRLVIMVDENAFPQYWKMGRIIEVHPGADKLVRVVSLKTANGVLKRAITKICLLPIDKSEIEETIIDKKS